MADRYSWTESWKEILNSFLTKIELNGKEFATENKPK